MKLLLATRNPNKAREIGQILASADVELESLADRPDLGQEEIAETGATFLENALIKAQWAAHRSGEAAVADDSGLEVDVLGGRPGIHSARFAGHNGDDAANNRKLVDELQSLGVVDRSARFRCAVVLFVPTHRATGRLQRLTETALAKPLDAVPEGTPVGLDDGVAVAVSGTLEGIIIDEPRGRGGFGYDPHFVLPELGRTTAELSAEEKNARSHRGQAFRKLAHVLARLER